MKKFLSHEMNFKILRQEGFYERNKRAKLNSYKIYEGKFKFSELEKYRNKGKSNFRKECIKRVRMERKQKVLKLN